MAMMEPTGWNPQDHPALQQAHEDEFQQFLNMGSIGNLGDGLQFEFPDFQNAGGAGLLGQGARDQMDTPMGGTEPTTIMARTNPSMSGQMPPMTTTISHGTIPTQMVPSSLQGKNDSDIDQIDAQIQYLQQQKLQHQQRQLQEQTAFFASQNHTIPPTPQSLEMQPTSTFFSPDMSHHQPAVFDNRFQRLKEQQDLAFTPLVSPAVTPLDPNFPVDAAYTVPGAYFSPLTSPALHAQTDPATGYEQRANSTSTNSPDVPNPDLPASQSSASDLSKKTRKNNAAKSSRKSGVRQSPISKPQRRKTASNPALVSQVLSEMTETNMTNGGEERSRDTIPTNMATEESEENGSVSPENLSDMPPPPIPQPKSAGRSPFIAPQNNNATAAFATAPSGKPSPATPATLMKLPVSSAANSASSGPIEPAMSEPIENFELPESANFPKPKPSPLDTQPQVLSPPETSSAKTPAFQPLPSPIFAKPTIAASASQSPQILPGSSASNPRKTPQLVPRGSKKRSSTGSVHVSPALRPKISPNIKPLLPGAGVSAEDTASRLLASKSNYQNILEGNTVPGVSYPSELSTNLTSKRTSHKIAEQGRRNRINSALQEIATLLPRSAIKESGLSEEEDAASRRDGKQAAGAPNSKASTVEMAIEYIKQLRREVAEATKRAEEAEMRLEQHEAGR